jgi:hypothetical protein
VAEILEGQEMALETARLEAAQQITEEPLHTAIVQVLDDV